MQRVCFSCKRQSTYVCIRCAVSVCVLCALEANDAEKETDYKPTSKVEICQQCNLRHTNHPLNTLRTPSTSNDNHESLKARESVPDEDEEAKPSERQSRPKRKQWTREEKLEFIDLYKKSRSKATAAKEFKLRHNVEIKSNTYNPWIQNEHKLRNAKHESRKHGAGRRAAFPDMEEKLFNEFKEMRARGMKVKEWWFRGRCKQLMEELHPGVEFKMSNHWFGRFKARYDISLRRPTNAK